MVDIGVRAHEEESGGVDVVLAGRHVERGQTAATARVLLEQCGHHAVVALLQRRSQWCETVLQRKRKSVTDG